MKKKARVEIVFNAQELIDTVKDTAEMIKAGRLGELRQTTLELPDPAPPLVPKQIRGIREKMGASQAMFARLLNVPKGTAIAWETGARRPSGAALKLLDIARRKPEVLVEP